MRGLLVIEMADKCDWAFYQDMHFLPCKNLKLYASWRELQGNDATLQDKCSPSTDGPKSNADSQPTPMTKESQDLLRNHFRCCFKRFVDAGTRNGGSCNGTFSTQPVCRT